MKKVTEAEKLLFNKYHSVCASIHLTMSCSDISNNS